MTEPHVGVRLSGSWPHVYLDPLKAPVLFLVSLLIVLFLLSLLGFLSLCPLFDEYHNLYITHASTLSFQLQ